MNLLETNSTGYEAELKDGSTIFIPKWPCSVGLENLTKAGKYIGGNNMITIATELSMATVILAITESEDAKQTAALIKHFVCSARLNGEKIMVNTYESLFEGNLTLSIEIFTHVVKAQYQDFFESGLAKETCPSN